MFQRKHLPMSEMNAHWQEQRAVQRRRLLEHMIAGRLEPRDIRIKLAGLDAGYAEGQQREVGGGEVASTPLTEFQPFEASKRRSVWMTTRPLRMRRDLEQAIERVNEGEIVSLLSLSRSSLYHKVRFTEEGVWLQSGGIFGRSKRDAPLVRLMGRRAREKMEHDRVAVQRGL